MSRELIRDINFFASKKKNFQFVGVHDGFSCSNLVSNYIIIHAHTHLFYPEVRCHDLIFQILERKTEDERSF